MESSWNEKLNIRWLRISVKRIKEETPEFKIIIDEIDRPGKGKKEIERKLARADFPAKAWDRIKSGATIMKCIREVMDETSTVSAADFTKDFNWGEISGGDSVCYCEICGDLFVVPDSDDPFASLDKVGKIHAADSPNCSGIKEQRFLILDHRSKLQVRAMSFLAAKVAQEKKQAAVS